MIIVILQIKAHKRTETYFSSKRLHKVVKPKGLFNKALFVWLSLLVKGFPFPVRNKFTFPPKTIPNETLIKSRKQADNLVMWPPVSWALVQCY